MAIDKMHSPKNVVLIVQGKQITGFKKDQFIKASQNEADFKQDVDADGDVTYVTGTDKTGKLTFTLVNNSNSIAFLYELLHQGRKNPVPLFFSFVDGNTGVASAGSFVFEKSPDYTTGMDRGDQEFVLLTKNIDIGNNALFIQPTSAALAVTTYAAAVAAYTALSVANNLVP
jgi:hypothetical protein